MVDTKRDKTIGGPDVLSKIDHCLSNIEEFGFEDGISWDTRVAKAVTVEEIVGALVHAEQKLQRQDFSNDAPIDGRQR